MGNKISVIVPVFNVANYLERCIKSIIGQTYDNFEIIFIDDGSTDLSGVICEEWGKKDDRIITIHQENLGVSVARNMGMACSTGEMIIFIDADDYIEKDMFNVMAYHLQTRSVDFVCCGYTTESFDKKEIHLQQEGILNEGEIMTALFKPYYLEGVVWNKLFARDTLLDDHGQFVKFREGMRNGEDNVWITEILRNCKTCYYVANTFYHYIKRADSATWLSDQNFEVAMRQLGAWEEIWNLCKDLSEEITSQVAEVYFQFLFGLLKRADSLQDSHASEILCVKLKNLMPNYVVHDLNGFLRKLKVRVVLGLKVCNINHKMVRIVENNLTIK